MRILLFGIALGLLTVSNHSFVYHIVIYVHSIVPQCEDWPVMPVVEVSIKRTPQ